MFGYSGLPSTVVFNNDATKVVNLLKVPEDDQEKRPLKNCRRRLSAR